MSFLGKWMALEIIMLSKINESYKDQQCIFSFICGIQGVREGHESKRRTTREVGGAGEMGKGKRG
jgi:hypothetical protein